MIPKPKIKPVYFLILAIWIVFLCTVFYLGGKEEGKAEDLDDLVAGECLEWGEFQCPGGEMYKFCDDYESTKRGEKHGF